MSNYFSYFPTVQNDLIQNGNYQTVTNIFRRFIVKPSVKSSVGAFYEYDIQAGDRPDTIAEKYYGDSAYAWIVLLMNDIIDPMFDWPLFNLDFDNFIISKYGSIVDSKNEVHEYRKILVEQQTLTNGTIIPEKYVVVDETTYNNTTPLKRTLISKYDYEEELNDSKRRIKILDKKYLTQLLEEVENILRDEA